MELPKFKLNFEFGQLFKIDKEVKIPISESSTILLDKLEDLNRGTLVFQVDSLDYYRAKEIGMRQIEDFLNLLVVTPKTEIPPATFANEPILLNPEKFEGITKTPFKTILAGSFINVRFEDIWAENASKLNGKANKLRNEKQQAINNSFFWLRKTTSAKTASENFVYRWISLEALCGVLEEKICASTESMINGLVNKMTNESAKDIFENHRTVIGELTKANLLGRNKRRNWSQELKAAMDTIEKNRDYKEVIKRTALCLYEVRNKLFHWGEKLFLVDGCNPLLKVLILKTLEDFLENL